MNIDTAYSNVRTMVESVKTATVPGKHTEGSVEYELLCEGASVAAELV